MTRKFYVKNIDCANCAAKAERAVAKVKGVKSAVLNFMLETLLLEVEDFNADEIVSEAIRVLKKKEPDAEVIAR